ncbi:MAG: hypothetical protein LBJ11_08920 [Oscillospiraceae bacterium]|nr:hypothetical protein [Oscillospiraceae bacterium]
MKEFDEFYATLTPDVVESVQKKITHDVEAFIEGKEFDADLAGAIKEMNMRNKMFSMRFTMVTLRMYHDWLRSNEERHEE